MLHSFIRCGFVDVNYELRSQIGLCVRVYAGSIISY